MILNPPKNIADSPKGESAGNHDVTYCMMAMFSAMFSGTAAVI